MKTFMRSASQLEELEIAVPASVANIGPGFDTLAVAIQLYLRVSITKVQAANQGLLNFRFSGRPLHGENYVERGFRFLAQGAQDFPSLDLEINSEIPMQSGLGSSAAAIVAGFKLYEALYQRQTIERLLTAAWELEGHADNAAAALLGGLAVCYQKHDGSVSAFSLPWPESLALVVLIPEVSLSTPQSRKVLPETISLGEAVSNLQRTLMLVQALQNSDYALLAEGLRDCWHQAFRQVLVPGLKEVLDLKHPDLLGVFLSGAGPSLVALARRNHQAIGELLARTYTSLRIGCEVKTLKVHPFTGRHLAAGIHQEQINEEMVSGRARPLC